MKIFGKDFGRRRASTTVRWCIARVVNDAEKFAGVVRFISERPAGQHKLNDAIEIVWRYSAAGLPDRATNERMNGFERAVDTLADENEHSQLVQVRSGFGEKVWLFYASDRGRFMAEFNELLQEHEKYPIDISFFKDPKWKLWSELVEPLRDRAEWSQDG